MAGIGAQQPNRGRLQLKALTKAGYYFGVAAVVV